MIVLNEEVIGYWPIIIQLSNTPTKVQLITTIFHEIRIIPWQKLKITKVAANRFPWKENWIFAWKTNNNRIPSLESCSNKNKCSNIKISSVSSQSVCDDARAHIVDNVDGVFCCVSFGRQRASFGASSKTISTLDIRLYTRRCVVICSHAKYGRTTHSFDAGLRLYDSQL